MIGYYGNYTMSLTTKGVQKSRRKMGILPNIQGECYFFMKFICFYQNTIRYVVEVFNLLNCMVTNYGLLRYLKRGFILEASFLSI